MAVIRKNCDSCGRPIELRQLGPKTWKPFDPDGSRHDCPGRVAGGRQVSAKSGGAQATKPPAQAAEPAMIPAAGAPMPSSGNGNGTGAKSSIWKAALVAILGVVAAFLIIPRFFGNHEPAQDAATIPNVPTISAPSANAGGPGATRTPKPRATATARATTAKAAATQPGEVPASEAPLACAAFSNQMWAQAIYDQDPGKHRDLDPDGDRFACEELPYGAVPALWTNAIPQKAEQVRLIGTIDGDTIIVRRKDGTTEHVRLVGIDTPETGKGTRPLECYGEEATNFTTGLMKGADGGVVWLEKDIEDRDKYDRLLRYVWYTNDGVVYMANDAIVRSGFAERYRDTPNRRYYQGFIDGQNFAKAHGYGLWTACQ